MKQFDLQEYLKNPEKKIVTRKGKSVRIICTNRLDDRYPVVAFIRLGDDYEDIWAFTKDGESGEHGENDYDLFFEPEKKTGWVNIYDFRGKIVCGVVYASEKAARGEIDPNKSYITTIPIEWEE